MNKAALRQRLREARVALGPTRRAQASHQIVQHLLELAEFRAASRIGLFWPLPHEVDLRPLFRCAPSKTLALPVVTAKRAPLTFRDGSGSLVTGPFRVQQPGPEAHEVPVTELDLLLMPALGVDPQGQRLGYGGGFYDRTVALCPQVRRLGVVFQVQVVPQIPVESHDFRLHGFITEAGLHPAR